MKLHLKRDEPAGAGLARISRELCARARRATARGDTLTDQAVFELRKTVKKLRALLRITRPALTPDTFRETDRLLRDFGRLLGRPRDAAVLVATYDDLLAYFRPLPDESALQPLRNALHCRYLVAQEDLLLANEEHALATRFGLIERHVAQLDLTQLSDAQLLQGIRKSYRRCRGLLRQLHREPSTENSHDLRRQVKYTWNQLRLLRKRDPQRLEPFIAGLDTLGRHLGKDSDLALLVDVLQRHPETGCGHIRTELIIALAEARRTAVLTASLRLADRLFAEPPGRFGSRLAPHAGQR
ncbi:MAG: CHAD domain-containing protein [Pseudomonadota bacterium]